MIGAQERHAEPSHEASQARSRLATHPAVLWQFRNSHFNEKVRWALDWKRVPHLRRSLVPGLHIGRALWMTGKKQVPVLSVDGQVTADSTAIIAVLERLVPDPPLYPRDPADRRRALELEDFFDEELGPHLRRALFHAVLPDADFASAFLTVGTGAVTPVHPGGPGEGGMRGEAPAHLGRRRGNRSVEPVGRLGRQDQRVEERRRGQVGDREALAHEVARGPELRPDVVERSADLPHAERSPRVVDPHVGPHDRAHEGKAEPVETLRHRARADGQERAREVGVGKHRVEERAAKVRA